MFSSTRIDLPESGSESDVITITGKKENVEKAQKKIAQIQSEMANVVSGNVEKILLTLFIFKYVLCFHDFFICFSVDVIIPSKIHNMMIGAGGKLIQSISDDCGGVAIKFPGK